MNEYHGDFVFLTRFSFTMEEQQLWLQSDSIEKIVKPTTLVMTKNNHIKNESHIATLLPWWVGGRLTYPIHTSAH